ncbi:hypothetical protein FE784_20175 [Paenibacillus hemerocallicola]|uniref:Uncharacterized protein n=1 Tax=Paenibacillus hemerocallicola TaxID=1172614 RepID=A0A5C4T5U3_9BACL|nr:hypothetical protein [Paenibacillus hemerocallicola]TNJ64441.1 hypothetical protein FE784_20175 [Paenibacillus hemerocallicola]
MDKRYCYSQNEIEKIRNRFGKAFYEKVLRDIETYADKWGEIYTELNTLYPYNGRRFCRVFDADIENGVLLEECVRPGLPIREESSLEKRLSVFCSLYKGLHKTR